MNTSCDTKVLYHYTSGDGLIGIMTEGTIWASSIHHLNDTREFWLALDLAAHALQEEAREHDNPAVPLLADDMIGALKSAASFSVFVTCFSEFGDSLSQWRGYCPLGAGYSIGFSVPALKAAAQRAGFTLEQCIYDPEKQKRKVREWARDTLAERLENAGSQTDSERSEPWFQRRYFERLFKFAPLLKDRSFKDEKEWRLVGSIVPRGPTARVRSQGSLLIPYVEIDLTPEKHAAANADIFEPLTIAHLVVGPTPHPQLNADAIDYIQSKFARRFRLEKSKIPFRSW